MATQYTSPSCPRHYQLLHQRLFRASWALAVESHRDSFIFKIKAIFTQHLHYTTFESAQFCVIWYTRNIVHPLPLSGATFSSPLKEILCPSSGHSSSILHSVLGNHGSAFLCVDLPIVSIAFTQSHITYDIGAWYGHLA